MLQYNIKFLIVISYCNVYDKTSFILFCLNTIVEMLLSYLLTILESLSFRNIPYTCCCISEYRVLQRISIHVLYHIHSLHSEEGGALIN